MTPEMLATLTEQVAELVQTYSNNYLQFQRATYNETQVRVDFVNRFFKFLGWDVDNERGLPQHLREVTHEATVVVEEDGVHRSKKPDYSFKVGTEVLYFLETKKPAVNLTIDAAPTFQLRRYGWSGNLKVSVLTNFTDLYIYDCSVRPREGDDIGVAMIAHYHFDEYVERFEEIYNMLSKEAVLAGQFERHFGNIQGALRREPFDQYFLDQIRAWRMMLGEDILCNNPNVDAETLNIFVQRVLNRTIFLRICEDRCFENYESLKAIATYQDLRTMFAAADQKYDSGLFELLEEDRLTVSDSVIIEIFQSLDIPKSGGAEYAASKHSIERIAKEGRKYGLSLMVVSQRPSEVSDTIFSQCNNFVVLKLTNINDQNCIKNLLPDNNSSLVDVLPTLSAGECLIVGDAAPLPAVIKMDMPNPIPNSSNVNVYDEWNKNWIDIAFETVIKRWWKE